MPTETEAERNRRIYLETEAEMARWTPEQHAASRARIERLMVKHGLTLRHLTKT